MKKPINTLFQFRCETYLGLLTYLLNVGARRL